MRLEPAFSGFYRPLAMVDRPDRGLLYVAEMPGRVKVLERATGKVTTALDLVGKVGTDAEQGLLGLALHPTEPYAYVTVERDKDATTIEDMPFRSEILRFTSHDGGKTFDPSSEKLILRLDRPTTFHYAGTLEFGPDGYLYIGVGDGGTNLTPLFGSERVRLLGTILRVDVDGGDPYAIPADNPFTAGETRPEIWARGLRNPWRFTFDRDNGQIWAGDVGNIRYEEVNVIERGKDYGWPTVEGNDCQTPRVGCDRSPFVPPRFAYPHAEGASITGGYVYRGRALPDLVGKYIFADYVVGRVWALEGSASEPKPVLLNPGGVRAMISSFGQDADGELYALGWDSGTIFRLVAGDPETIPALPSLLSATGCVVSTDPKQPAPGLVPYDVNVELWSDGADKTRFVAIPDGTSVHVEDSGDFTLPEGSVLMKTFTIGGKRIETRLLLRHPGGTWSGASYQWKDDETDAVLLDTGAEKALPNGQTWTFPSSAQCFVCHTNGAGIALGLETLQLNRDSLFGGTLAANQLTKFSQIGYLDRAIDAASAPRLPPITGDAPLEDRARAYLHANCSMCHREDGTTTSRMDLRFGLPLAAIKGCSPSSMSGTTDLQIITPGDPQRSAIFRRPSTREDEMMPPLASRISDPVALPLLETWIRSLQSCE